VSVEVREEGQASRVYPIPRSALSGDNSEMVIWETTKIIKQFSFSKIRVQNYFRFQFIYRP
jgi:hypothetical protein